MNNFGILKKVIKLLKPYKFKFFLIMLCVIMLTVVSIINPLIIKNITDDGLLQHNLSTVIKMSLILLLLAVSQGILTLIQETIRIKLQNNIVYTLNKKTFLKLSRVKIEEIKDINDTDLFNRIYTDINNISRVADKNILFITTQIFTIIGSCVGLFLISWKLSLIVLSIAPIKFFCAKYFSKLRMKYEKLFINKSSEFANWYGDVIAGIKDVRLYGLINTKLIELKSKQKELIHIRQKLNILSEINMVTESISIQTLISILYIVGAIFLIGGELSYGSIIALISYSIKVTSPLSAIMNIGYYLTGIIPSARRYFDFMDLENEMEANTHKNITLNCLPTKHPILTFKDVSFAYDNNNTVVNNIDIEIREGEKIAFIGDNGSGKSTMLNLLLRFYTPNNGKILLYNTDINYYPIDEYRQHFATVMQNSHLFQNTIKDNIVLDKKISNDMFDNIISMSELSDFYNTLPDSYMIGQNGSCLSGGQSQKIAIARAIAKDSKIFILDEATSSLDIRSEINISKLINSHLVNKTVICVTHRPELLKYMDRIILLDKGNITQIGTHDELLQLSQLYKKIIS